MQKAKEGRPSSWGDFGGRPMQKNKSGHPTPTLPVSQKDGYRNDGKDTANGQHKDTPISNARTSPNGVPLRKEKRGPSWKTISKKGDPVPPDLFIILYNLFAQHRADKHNGGSKPLGSRKPVPTVDPEPNQFRGEQDVLYFKTFWNLEKRGGPAKILAPRNQRGFKLDYMLNHIERKKPGNVKPARP